MVDTSGRSLQDPHALQPVRTRQVDCRSTSGHGREPFGADVILDLQRLAGNQAVTKLISSRKAIPVQRFSAGSLATGQPIPWLAETTSVTRPDEGVSGGVYFMHSDAGTLVAKPEDTFGVGPYATELTEKESKREAGNAKARAGFAETFLTKVMKFKTPGMRFVDKDADRDEFNGLKIAIRSKLVLKKGQARPDYAFPGVRHFSVMLQAAGSSLSTVATKAGKQSMQEQDTLPIKVLLDRLTNEATLMNIARLAVADAFVGNSDRISASKSNIGNLMLTDSGKVTAIDHAATMKMPAGRSMLDSMLSQVTDVFTRRELIFASLIEGIEGRLEDAGVNEHGLSYWLTPEVLKHMKAVFDVGIGLGITDIQEALAKPGVREELKAQAERFPSAMVNWNSFLVTERYFSLLADGTDPKAALGEAQSYFVELKAQADLAAQNPQPAVHQDDEDQEPLDAPRRKGRLRTLLSSGVSKLKKLFG
jgi:hypothetical protein